MRLFHVLFALSLLLSARASSLDWRQPGPHPLDARDLGDACAPLNGQYIVYSSKKPSMDFGPLDMCLCISDIPHFISYTILGFDSSEIFGADAVTNSVTTWINNQVAAENCQYPDNSVPTCDGGEACAFTCINGFTFTASDPPTCTCLPPLVNCNGQCQDPGACPSSLSSSSGSGGSAHSRKRRWVGSGSCMAKGPEWAACGVYGGGPRAWECVNIGRDLESCGGCTLALTPFSLIGKDCSVLPGAADVSCLHGECVIYRCLPGYELALDHHSCIRKYSQLDDAEDVPARVYGLEHVPLGRQ